MIGQNIKWALSIIILFVLNSTSLAATKCKDSLHSKSKHTQPVLKDFYKRVGNEALANRIINEPIIRDFFIPKVPFHLPKDSFYDGNINWTHKSKHDQEAPDSFDMVTVYRGFVDIKLQDLLLKNKTYRTGYNQDGKKLDVIWAAPFKLLAAEYTAGTYALGSSEGFYVELTLPRFLISFNRKSINADPKNPTEIEHEYDYNHLAEMHIRGDLLLDWRKFITGITKVWRINPDRSQGKQPGPWEYFKREELSQEEIEGLRALWTK